MSNSFNGKKMDLDLSFVVQYYLPITLGPPIKNVEKVMVNNQSVTVKTAK